jgi:hypothetical protein
VLSESSARGQLTVQARFVLRLVGKVGAEDPVDADLAHVFEETRSQRIFEVVIKSHCIVDPVAELAKLRLVDCIPMLAEEVQELPHDGVVRPLVIHTVDQAVFRWGALVSPLLLKSREQHGELSKGFLRTSAFEHALGRKSGVIGLDAPSAHDDYYYSHRSGYHAEQVKRTQ